MTQDERIEKLERTVEKIESYLRRTPVPHIEPIWARLAALDKRVQEIEEKLKNQTR